MKSMARFSVLPITVIIIITMICSIACAPKSDIPLPIMPEPTVSATVAPTATPTPTASPVPTPTPIFSEARTAELNQQIRDFINQEGIFTREKMNEISLRNNSEKKATPTEFGIIFNSPRLEGYFFDYFTKDQNIVLVMGFDGKEGKRFVTLLEIALDYLHNQPFYSFSFAKLAERALYTEFTVIKRFSDGNTEGFSSYLDMLKGRVIVIQPSITQFSGDYSGIIADFVAEHNSKVGLSGKLISLVPSNNIKITSDSYIEGSYDEYQIITFDELKDIQDIDLANVPFIDPAIIFY